MTKKPPDQIGIFSQPANNGHPLSGQTLFIKPGSPGENGYIESFNGKMRDELLNREVFCSLKEAAITIEMWHRHNNTVRPYSSLGYRPPAPATLVQHASYFEEFRLT